MTELSRAIGLMSGTSLDAIDIAVIDTDGEGRVTRHAGLAQAVAIDEPTRALIRTAMDHAAAGELNHPTIGAADRAVTRAHGVTDTLLALWQDEGRLQRDGVDMVGFHGQTILHRPEAHFTRQLGNGQALADMIGIDVVNDFRAGDIAAGGEGAPLVPVYHRALAYSARLPLPVAFLNIGGVANVTWIGRECPEEGGLLAFDTGPGNALIDDHLRRYGDESFDADGGAARRGQASMQFVQSILRDPFFARHPPKSLDRDHFAQAVADQFRSHGLAGAHILEDGAATLTRLTVEAVAAASEHFPQPVNRWIVSGGGARNRTLMEWLSVRLGTPVETAEAHGWSCEFMEAEAFAYLAVRSSKGLPLSYPATTGVPAPMTGGRLHKAGSRTCEGRNQENHRK